MTKKLTGLHPLAYMGVEAEKPPNLSTHNRDPLVTDYQEFALGSLWLRPVVNRIYMLTDKTAGIATWLEISTSSGGDDVESLIADDSLHAQPDVAGDVAIVGGTNVTTSASIPNQLKIDLDDNVTLAGNLNVGGDLTVTGDMPAIDDVVVNNTLTVGGVTTLSNLSTGILQSDATGILSSSNGGNGEILIGGGAAPAWNAITPGTGVSVVNGAGSIEINNQLTINAQTGTSYTFVLTDAGKLITLDNAAAITLTVPPNGSVAFPIGTEIVITQKGAGEVTVAPGAGVTINSSYSGMATYEQYSLAALVKVETEIWYLGGDLS